MYIGRAMRCLDNIGLEGNFGAIKVHVQEMYFKNKISVSINYTAY